MSSLSRSILHRNYLTIQANSKYKIHLTMHKSHDIMIDMKLTALVLIADKQLDTNGEGFSPRGLKFNKEVEVRNEFQEGSEQYLGRAKLVRCEDRLYAEMDPYDDRVAAMSRGGRRLYPAIGGIALKRNKTGNIFLDYRVTSIGVSVRKNQDHRIPPLKKPRKRKK